ncbi:hypothetical protein B0H34DRAFT_680787 [Crassisporium funariophilum]|nr:hypothetical protein B0H34DRAFT_680787 [Crassisporium funariophilum]
MAEAFDLESLVHVEQTFYETGHEDGFAHGRVHGLIEGRALGREQGFEMWEELGFYEGFALTWRAILAKQSREDDRASQHIRHLLESISQFPRVNPSALASAEDSSASGELDISKLQRQIRSRYRALCSTLGVRPRLRSSEAVTPDERKTDDVEMGDEEDQSGQQKSKSVIPVWKLDNAGMKKPVTNEDLNF